MFTGVTFEQAMKYYQEGKEVLVLDKMSVPINGRGYDVFPFEELFRNLQFLADVAAVKNPEFQQVIEEMQGNAPITNKKGEENIRLLDTSENTQVAENSPCDALEEKIAADAVPETSSEIFGGVRRNVSLKRQNSR